MSELFVRAAIITIAVGCCGLPVLGQSAVVPTIDNPNRAAVSGIPAARRFWHLAATRRVDVALIGDSNSRVGAVSSGHEDWMGRALAARFGMYATRVEPVAASAFQVQGVVAWACAPFAGFGSIPAADAISFPAAPFPAGYAALPEGASAPSTYNCGMVLSSDGPLPIADALRYHLTCLCTGTAAASLNISAREGWPGNIGHNYAARPVAFLESSQPRLDDIAMDIPAGERAPTGLMLCLTNYAENRGAQGPFAATWQRVECPSRSTGIAYSPLWEAGGRSARYTLFSFQTENVHAPMLEWFRQITRLQNNGPALLIHILHGGNDCNDYNPSLGAIGGLDSSTGPGHEDNIRAIIALLRQWWIDAGNDPQLLFFQLGPYHPRPEHAQQLAFEQAWRNIVAQDPQVFAVAGNLLSTENEFLIRGLRINAFDPYHLSYQGFSTWANATVRALDTAICPGDYDQSGSCTIADIFAYLEAWFAGSIRADFNYSGTLEVQDIFDYLGAWFSGC